MRFPCRLFFLPSVDVVLGGALVGDDPKPAPPQAHDLLPPLFRKLGLSDEQVAAVAKVRTKYDAKVKDMQEKIKAARAEEAAEVEKVLTDTQRARLKELRKDTPAKGP
jgi:hypothetical protein